MKIAHLILAHAYPQQLLRLVEKLHHPAADIYLCIDAKSNFDDFKAVTSLPYVKDIKNNVEVYWGNYSMVKASLQAVENILATGITYSHINFLSGQDYPLKPVSSFHAFLAANEGKSFVCSLSVKNQWTHGLARTKTVHLGDYNFPGKYRLQKIINFFHLKRKVPGGLQIYGGSQWFTITPQAAAYVVTYIKEHKDLEGFFRKTFAADEIVFQTVLEASPFKSELVNDNLRMIEMSQINFRPTILDSAKKDMLFNSGKFFARKFAPGVSDALMDDLDEII